jgi:hypothetical protein
MGIWFGWVELELAKRIPDTGVWRLIGCWGVFDRYIRYGNCGIFVCLCVFSFVFLCAMLESEL